MRIGIIGCGLIGTKRAEAAAKPHRIVAVADPNGARASALGERFGAKVCADWREVVDTDLDIVVVATPHDQLAPISAVAAAAGKHVLVEKPAARNAGELAAVVAAAERTGVRVKVGFNHRFHPALLKARQLVDEGVTGPLLYVRGRYGHGGRRGYEAEWRMEKAISGGGELIDQGAHLIDLSRWFLGDFTEISGHIGTYFWPVAVEDNCFISLATGSGQVAWLHASWSEWKNLFSFEIFGRDAKLQVDGLGGSYGVERLTCYKMLPEMGPPETTTWEYPFPDRSWALEFDDFVRAIEEGRRPCGDIADARAMLEIVDQLYARTSLHPSARVSA